MTKDGFRQLIREVIREARIYRGSGDSSSDNALSISTEYELTPEEQAALKNMTPKKRQVFATKKLHQARRAKGLCIQCGVNYTRTKPDGTKAVYCDECLQNFKTIRNRLIQKRKSCSRCPNPPLPVKNFARNA